jgi:hypothetical protein
MSDQPQGATLTAAHTETVAYRVTLSYPEHAPREHDPHYKAFHEAHDRLKRLGELKCWVGNADCIGDMELHHNIVEDALINDVDRIKLALDHPVFTTDSDDAFLDLIQGEGNLLCLCRMHHIGALGVHCMPYPSWNVQKYLKAGIAAPGRRAGADSAPSGDPQSGGTDGKE